ncbi:MAG: hypothetical protein MOB07_31420 [Acidobacteria bacterium]|nr:hypothetical protein [Acidobacteriota bacterium]
MTITPKDQIQNLAAAAAKKQAEMLHSAKSNFVSINNQIFNVRDNGEFEAGVTPAEQIIALHAAANCIAAYVREAKLQLEEAERCLKMSQTLNGVLAEM